MISFFTLFQVSEYPQWNQPRKSDINYLNDYWTHKDGRFYTLQVWEDDRGHLCMTDSDIFSGWVCGPDFEVGFDPSPYNPEDLIMEGFL